MCTQWIPHNSWFLTCCTLAWIITRHSDTGHIYYFVDKIKVKLTRRFTICDEYESCRSGEVYGGCKGDSPGKHRWISLWLRILKLYKNIQYQWICKKAVLHIPPFTMLCMYMLVVLSSREVDITISETIRWS